jgi:hypothetical protein
MQRLVHDWYMKARSRGRARCACPERVIRVISGICSARPVNLQLQKMVRCAGTVARAKYALFPRGSARSAPDPLPTFSTSPRSSAKCHKDCKKCPINLPLASGLFEQNAEQMFERLHGVGVAVVNALSEVLDLRIWREGKEHFMRFHMGDLEAPLAIVGNADVLDGKPHRGTEITFLPSIRFFTKTEFDFVRIEHRLHELASLNAGVTIVLADKRAVQTKEIVLRI